MGVVLGGLVVWILILALAAIDSPRTATARHEGWTVRSIQARIEREQNERQRREPGLGYRRAA
ncbi:hypothetical protein HLB23_28845 [Nocardia uniformis]|uniref:Uncharacterized protein n=1 Tax=Nocardia uniformis TaxID=53432 RepID=A0A849C542_9NOCA|nr:hypothetical protein [Nocardia uniformis]NNH73814.1 hypothetical protein [Nocardia uniformis]